MWNTAVPYLKSVDSKGDRQAPNNETTVTIAAKALAERLGIAEDAAVSVTKRTEAGYVAEVQAGSKTFSGLSLIHIYIEQIAREQRGMVKSNEILYINRGE